jgi:hypothetical protein
MKQQLDYRIYLNGSKDIMNKKAYPSLIGLYIIVLALTGCHAMAVLFHGEEPEDPPATFLVVYNANGASGTVPGSQSVTQGSAIILPDKGNLTYSGNVFIGWNENQAGSGTTYASGSSVTVNKNITFYARWIDSSTPQYTVIFNANGATGGSAPVSKTVYSGTSITIPGQGTLVFSGKDFTGWNTRADGSGVFYSTGSSVTVTGNATLFAQWADVPPEGAKTYTVNSPQAFTDAFAAINASSKEETHIITITGEYVVNRITLAANAKKTIILRGGGSPCVLYNNNDGGDAPLFTVPNRITFVLENNITLNGNQKYYPAVKVSLGGTLEMKAGAVITGAYGRGVEVDGGIFNMNGGTINSNRAGSTGSGGGVLVHDNGTFNLSDGIISDNTGNGNGGGVYVTEATFNMTGGIINGNFGGDITDSYSSGGGGVMVGEEGVFIMSNGTIRNNTAQSSYGAYGGGVLVGEDASFTMSGGTITSNTVTAPRGGTYGGWVCVWGPVGGIFTKNGSSVIDATNSAQAGKVACVYTGSISGNAVRNTTAGPSVNMNSLIAGSPGGWE